MMKIYSVANRQEAKEYIGKPCLFSDDCFSIEKCNFIFTKPGILQEVIKDEDDHVFVCKGSELCYRYVMPINEDVLLEIGQGIKCYDKHDTFGALFMLLLKLSGDIK